MRRLALAVAGTAVAGLTACTTSAPAESQAAASSPAAASSQAASSSAMSVGCRQQYDAWRRGPGKGLVASLSAVGSAAQAGNIRVLTAMLEKAGPALRRAARNPMPACVDPEGYWPVLLMHVNAAAASTASAATVTAAMKGVSALTRELNTELKRT